MGNECPNVESHETENLYVIFYDRIVCMLYRDELLIALAAIEDIHSIWPQNVTVRPQELWYDQFSSPKRPQPSLHMSGVQIPSTRLRPLSRLSMKIPWRNHPRQVKRNTKGCPEGRARPF